MVRDLPLIDASQNGVVPLFMPYVTDAMRSRVVEQLNTRWLGQGPGVDAFEAQFEAEVLEGDGHAIAVSSGTAALHIAYTLALGATDGHPATESRNEVIAPVFTCTATNIPWLYLGMKIQWADIDLDSMNISADSVEALISPRTRAISVVHYGGHPADMTRIRAIAEAAGIPVIEDAAQALGARQSGSPIGHHSDFTTFSFQAIKHITTGDGGMLVVRDKDQADAARRLRWFGIDRKGKQNGTWENDVFELGFKYQMTDIAAALGSAALPDLKDIIAHRGQLLDRYCTNLKDEHRVRVLNVDDAAHGDRHAAWLATVVIRHGDCASLRQALRDAGIESNAVHFRNDRYTVFRESASGICPNMDSLDGRYLCLPLHMGVSMNDVDRACEVVSGAW